MKMHLRAVLLGLVLLLVCQNCCSAQSAQYKEYEIKAAFIYNFLKFVDWPPDKPVFNRGEITIGIIGQDHFAGAFDAFKDKQVKDCNVTVRRFESFEKLQNAPAQQRAENLGQCHILFICDSERSRIPEIIKLVSQQGVLTVSDTDRFLQAGGVINFVLEDNKIRFEINATAAERAKLEMRSQLLRLAKDVVKFE